MTSICALLFLLAAPASAQIVGGGSETLYQWNGVNSGIQLGQSVSDAGDVNADGIPDVIVGTSLIDIGGLFDIGRVYVYSGADGMLLHQWSGTNQGDYFGTSVAGAGDVNGDGYADVIVGADGVDFGGLSNVGSAFVYSGIDGSLLYEWSGGSQNAQLGNSVSGAGDVNGDGVADVIVGSHFYNSGGMTFAGAAYVYSGLDGSLLHQWIGGAALDLLGKSVSGAGDINGDGFADLIVGAVGADVGGLVTAGSVYAFSGADSSLLYQWDSPGGNQEDYGFSVSDAGDLNSDGFADVIVGHRYADAGGLNTSGSAYVYSGADGSLLYQWNGEAAGDRLGQSVSAMGDLDGDGFTDVIVGATGVGDGRLQDAGAALVFSGADGTLLRQWTGEASGDYLGHSVSGAGDVNSDSFADVIVGALYTSFSGINDSGSVYVLGYHPFLTASTPSISTSTGGVLDLTLNFPDTFATPLDYIVLMSVAGTGPIFYGVEIPLSLDSFLIDSANGIYPFNPTSNLHGTLDVSGNASASITFPAGAFSFAVGQTFWLAAVSFPTGQLPVRSSIAVAVEFLP